MITDKIIRLIIDFALLLLVVISIITPFFATFSIVISEFVVASIIFNVINILLPFINIYIYCFMETKRLSCSYWTNRRYTVISIITIILNIIAVCLAIGATIASILYYINAQFIYYIINVILTIVISIIVLMGTLFTHGMFYYNFYENNNIIIENQNVETYLIN